MSTSSGHTHDMSTQAKPWEDGCARCVFSVFTGSTATPVLTIYMVIWWGRGPRAKSSSSLDKICMLLSQINPHYSSILVHELNLFYDFGKDSHFCVCVWACKQKQNSAKWFCLWTKSFANRSVCEPRYHCLGLLSKHSLDYKFSAETFLHHLKV